MRISPRTYHSEAQLAELGGPGSAFERACCLEDLGRSEEAAEAYGTLLREDPRHFGALTNLGLLLLERDAPEAARPYLAAAAALRPAEPRARANLARAEREAGATEAARAGYEAALRLDPGHVEAHYGLALLYEALGDAARASSHFARACAQPICWVGPYRGAAPPIRVLVLASVRGGDLVTNLFLDDALFQSYVLAVETFRPGLPLPPHDVVLNAIGDADRAAGALACAAEIVRKSGAPLVNDPARVGATGRAENAARLASIPNVVVPRIERLPRSALRAGELVRRGWRFPLLLRAPGYHAGRNFERADDEAELARALERLPHPELFVLSFVDVRGPDGIVRKYRAVFVGGRLYPVHLAASSGWKVHAFSADAEGDGQRREEARFLEDPAALGPRAYAALLAVGEALGLDYAGVDFSLDAQGALVLFEANATMAVYPPADPRRHGRRAACERVLAAMQALLRERAFPRDS